MIKNNCNEIKLRQANNFHIARLSFFKIFSKQQPITLDVHLDKVLGAHHTAKQENNDKGPESNFFFPN